MCGGVWRGVVGGWVCSRARVRSIVASQLSTARPAMFAHEPSVRVGPRVLAVSGVVVVMGITPRPRLNITPSLDVRVCADQPVRRRRVHEGPAIGIGAVDRDPCGIDVELNVVGEVQVAIVSGRLIPVECPLVLVVAAPDDDTRVSRESSHLPRVRVRDRVRVRVRVRIRVRGSRVTCPGELSMAEGVWQSRWVGGRCQGGSEAGRTGSREAGWAGVAGSRSGRVA